MTTRVYGCKPSAPVEKLIHGYHPASTATTTLPAAVDFRTTKLLPTVFDQGQLGSCTANAGAGAYSYEFARQGGSLNYHPSRLFIYYNERALEGTIGEDAGASITDTCRSLHQYGAPTERLWPYDISKFTTRPPAHLYELGQGDYLTGYQAVPGTETGIKSMLAAGYSVLIGIQVYESFEQVGRNGVIPLPARGEALMGGHALLCVGYLSGAALKTALAARGLSTSGINTAITYVIVRNSWSTGWGDSGYCYMPVTYLTNPSLAFDFWAVEVVAAPGLKSAVRKASRSLLQRLLSWLR